ncbi:hypothetical protein V9T40_000064 [Parthenolecanium corni]|uniref:Uncharacterized protein n=1 Tax=Parthenolecanium corni TaxID=536013 RepID=A0AAN9TDP0_9HEMI
MFLNRIRSYFRHSVVPRAPSMVSGPPRSCYSPTFSVPSDGLWPVYSPEQGVVLQPRGFFSPVLFLVSLSIAGVGSVFALEDFVQFGGKTPGFLLSPDGTSPLDVSDPSTVSEFLLFISLWSMFQGSNPMLAAPS